MASKQNPKNKNLATTNLTSTGLVDAFSTAEKNRRHGLCKLTKQHVFGSTPFKDLTQEEFKMKYLTGYKGPRAEELEQHHQSRALKLGLSGVVLDPKVHKVNMHDTVKQRVLEQNVPVYSYPSETNCSWYDVSCWLRWVWRVANLNLGSLIGTMEPKYDADSYPTCKYRITSRSWSLGFSQIKLGCANH